MDRKVENIFTSTAVFLLIVSLSILIVFKDSNKILNVIAGIMMICSMILCLWIMYFSNVKPLALSIFFTLITLVCSLATMYIAHCFGVQSAFPLGIIMALLVSKILNKNLLNIKKLFSRFSN